jgi:uncharacterized membrane protein
MSSVVAALDFLFGCHHRNLSRVFTIHGRTYRVCCDCGAEFKYSLTNMSIEHRLPRDPMLTSLRIA